MTDGTKLDITVTKQGEDATQQPSHMPALHLHTQDGFLHFEHDGDAGAASAAKMRTVGQ